MPAFSFWGFSTDDSLAADVGGRGDGFSPTGLIDLSESGGAVVWGDCASESQRAGIFACRISPCRPRSIRVPQRQTAGFFLRGPPHHVTRRRRNVGRLGTTGRVSHFGPPTQLIFCFRAGPCAKTFETRQNRAMFPTGTIEDPGALIRRNRISLSGIRRYGGRVSHLSFCFENAMTSLTDACRAAGGAPLGFMVFRAHEPSASLPNWAPKRQSRCPGI